MSIPPEWPRERLRLKGPRALTLKECLAVLLGPAGPATQELCQRIVERCAPGLPGIEAERAFFISLEATGGANLAGITGLGEVGRARIEAAFELARRYRVQRDASGRAGTRRAGPDLRDQALARVPDELRAEPQEWLGFVPAYVAAHGFRMGEFCLVERGIRTHVNSDPAEIFARVLALRPQGIYLFHNHPTGFLVPSPADEDLTRRVGHLCETLGMRLFGHGIVSSRGDHWIVP